MLTVAEKVTPKNHVGFKRVLVATDFSEASRKALAHALRIARRFAGDITLVHAIAPAGAYQPIPMDPLPRELDRQLLQAEEEMTSLVKQQAIKDVPCHTVVQEGRVWDVLSTLMQEEHADLIVVGTHGRGGLKKIVLGSIAEQVVRLADSPVLTVGPQVPDPPSGEQSFSTILFATDFGPASAKAFPYALSLAEEYAAKLILLHVVPLPVMGPGAFGASEYAANELIQWESRVQEDSAQKLRDLIPPDAALACEPEYVVGTNFVPDGILSCAETNKADLIVMGVNAAGSARIASHFPWDLTHEVVCRANCPVLTVRV